MGREVKRVSLDFNWPVNKTWPGYCLSIYESIKEYCPTDDVDELAAICAKILNAEFSDCSDLGKIEVPTGEGWQMWETVTEGSPMSPVFKTPEELAQWLTDNNASACGSMTATYEQWLATIKQGYAVSAVVTPQKGFQSGVEANEEDK